MLFRKSVVAEGRRRAESVCGREGEVVRERAGCMWERGVVEADFSMTSAMRTAGGLRFRVLEGWANSNTIGRQIYHKERWRMKTSMSRANGLGDKVVGSVEKI